MPAREFIRTALFLFVLMGALSCIELMIPLFAHAKNQRRTFTNLGLTLVTFLFNWLLYSLAAIAALLVSAGHAGLLARFHLSSAAIILISVLVLDVATYLAHLTMHKVPLLWGFHRVHHSDRFVDATTTLRQHPLEGVWRFLWITVPVWILGLSPIGVAFYRTLSAANGLIEHSNIQLRAKLDSAVSFVWTTPNMHKIHHSRESKQTDSNYGNLLTLCDRIFGTFRPTEEALSVVYGLENVDDKQSQSFSSLMALPFRNSRTHAPDLTANKNPLEVQVQSQ